MEQYLVFLHGASNGSAEAEHALTLALSELCELSREDSKKLLEEAPLILRQGISKAQAEDLVSRLEEIGAIAEAIQGCAIECSVIEDSSTVDSQTLPDSEQINSAELALQFEESESPEARKAAEILEFEKLEKLQDIQQTDTYETATTEAEESKALQAGCDAEIDGCPEQLRAAVSPLAFRKKFVWLLISGVVLFFLAYLFKTPEPEEERSMVRIDVEALLRQQKQILEDSEEINSKGPALVLDYFSGRNQSSELDMTAVLVVSSGLLHNLRFSLSSKQPPPLTPEEIVLKTPSRLWVRKAEGSFSKVDKDKDIISGLAKVYLSDGRKTDRLLLPMFAKIRKTEDGLSLAWAMSSELEAERKLPDKLEGISSDSFNLTQENGGVLLNASGLLSLTLKESSPRR